MTKKKNSKRAKTQPKTPSPKTACTHNTAKTKPTSSSSSPSPYPHLGDWRIKFDESLADIDTAKAETKGAQQEVARLKVVKQEADDANETLKKDNRKLAEETIDLREELEELNRNLMGADGTIKKQEEEKVELVNKLDELDEALHMEEEKESRPLTLSGMN